MILIFGGYSSLVQCEFSDIQHVVMGNTLLPYESRAQCRYKLSQVQCVQESRYRLRLELSYIISPVSILY